MKSVIRFLRGFSREIAFAGLCGFALWCGGGAARDGLPRLIGAVTPGMAAQAGIAAPPVHRTTALLSLPGFAQSRFAPQILYPVTAKAFPAWMSSRPPARPSMPVIAICIDDLGEDLTGTVRALRLPSAVALAFLPFADSTPAFAAEGRERGHTVLAHVPMQALGPSNPGPMALMVGMAPDEILRRLNWSLARVPGAVGVNNHEGSRFTSDAAALQPVMTALKARGLFFFDSRTSGGSIGVAAARAAGIETLGRDIFLDDDPSEAAVAAQLAALAATAKRQGVAVAIGHPREVTLRLVAQWLAEDHGVRLVTLPEAMRLKAQGLAAFAEK